MSSPAVAYATAPRTEDIPSTTSTAPWELMDPVNPPATMAPRYTRTASSQRTQATYRYRLPGGDGPVPSAGTPRVLTGAAMTWIVAAQGPIRKGAGPKGRGWKPTWRGGCQHPLPRSGAEPQRRAEEAP
jgi:hypothetical protein